MSENFNDLARQAARYLHFEYEDPAIPDVQFNSTTDAINWLMENDWGPESWFKPYGMIEERIRVVDWDGQHMGDLIRVRKNVLLIRNGQHQIYALRDINFGKS